MVINCLVCTNPFRTFPSQIKLGKGKYCSYKCYGIAQGGKKERICLNCKIVFNVKSSKIGQGRGKYCSRVCHNLDRRNHIYKREEEHQNWKGDKVKYVALHQWVYRQLGQPDYCSNPSCIYPRKDSQGKLMITPKRYEWANKSHEYKRELSDWLRLCASCHTKYDLGKIFI